MSYKDLLVVLDGDAAARGRIELAATLAERFAAHLVGLYPLPNFEMPPQPGYFTPALLDPLYQELRQKAGEQAEEVHQAFEQAVRLRGLSAEWRAITEGPDADPALHARYADLAILGQIDPDRSAAETIRPRPERVTLASGRPILVVPYAGHSASVGQRVATRAIADAMPLLAAAETVTVLAIDPREGPGAHGEVPGADISLHLARHGVKATIERTVSAEVPVGEVLLSRAADLGADLLVMGAYGHSRVLEFVLGGTTQDLLEDTTIPVLISR
jgi:nucleotide-binding universal stress UspA family protein